MAESQTLWEPLVYVVLMWAPWIICAVAVRIPLAVSVPAGHDGRPLSVYEIAYLAGGVERTVTTVIAALVERGQLLVDRGRRKLVPVGPWPTDPLERAVADAAAKNDSFYPIFGVVEQTRVSDPMRMLVGGLERCGLVVPYRRVRSNRQVRKWLCLVVLVLGATGWATGFVSDSAADPMGVLMVTQALMTVLAWRSVKAPSQPPSPSGRQLLRAITSTMKSATSAPTDPRLTGAAGAVALGGLADYPDADVRSALQALSPSRSGGGGDGGGDGGE